MHLGQENKIKILIRRAGPNYLEGLRKVKAASDKLGLGIKVYGPETHITAIIPMALGLVEPLPEPDLSAPAGPPVGTWAKLVISCSTSYNTCIIHVINLYAALSRGPQNDWLEGSKVTDSRKRHKVSQYISVYLSISQYISVQYISVYLSMYILT